MSKIEDQISTLVSNLKEQVATDSDISQTIKTLHECIMVASSVEIISYVDGESLEALITVTNAAKDPETLLHIEDIIDLVLRSVSPNVLLKKFLPQFIFALNSKSAIVKFKFLQAMRKTIGNDPESLNDISRNGCPILIAASRCISDSDPSVYGEAQRFLNSVADSGQGCSLLFQQNDLVIKTLLELLNGTEIVRFRCFDIISSFSQKSSTLFNECLKAGFIDQLLKELDNPDILIKLNVLEILTTMSINALHCLKYFHSCGMLTKIYQLLEQSQTDPDATFLFPGVIKFFGHLARVDPKNFDEQYPAYLKAVFHMVINYRLLEVSQRLLAFDSLGLMASTSAGKSILKRHGTDMQSCMKAFGESIREGPMQLRSRHIEALKGVFTIEMERLNDSETLTLTEQWMNWMKPGTIEDPIAFLFDVLKRPIPEIRPAMCALFKSFIVFPWAQIQILSQNGIIDFIAAPLNDRDPHFNLFRHELASFILKTESCFSKLQDDQKQRLQQFYDAGPYYKGISTVDVAMEST